MKMHNATYEERLSTTVSLLLLHATGIVSCGLVLLVTFRGKLYQTRVNLLLANVAFADFLLVLSQSLLQPPNIMSDKKNIICDWCGWITYVAGLEASWFVPVLVLNRYISIFHSAAFKKIYTTRNIILMITGGWLVAILFVTPFQLGGVTGYEYQYENCGVNTTDAHPIWEVLVYLLIVLPTFIGNSITAFCNFRIFLRLRQHAKGNGHTLKNNVIAQNKQLMYVTLLYTMYAVCLQSPYILGKLAPAVIEDNPLRLVFPCLYVFNSTISSLTTLYVVKPYRKAFLDLTHCRGNQVQPKITSTADAADSRRNSNRNGAEGANDQSGERRGSTNRSGRIMVQHI